MKMKDSRPGKTATERLDNEVIAGIAWMVLAGILFTTMTAVIKHLGSTLPTSTIVFFRMVVGLGGVAS